MQEVRLFDSVRKEALTTFSEGSDEEKVARQIQTLPEVQVIPYEDPDIICALPESAVRRAFPTCPPFSWAEIVNRYRAASGGAGFKEFALKQLGLADHRIVAGQLIDKTLEARRPEEGGSKPLERAVRELLASLP